jgi:hypothetical protein
VRTADGEGLRKNLDATSPSSVARTDSRRRAPLSLPCERLSVRLREQREKQPCKTNQDAETRYDYRWKTRVQLAPFAASTSHSDSPTNQSECSVREPSGTDQHQK